MKKIFYCITFFFSILTCQAQIGMGEWKIFSTFYEPSKIIETPELVYFISDGYLYSYDKNYDEYKEYNTQNLLNDNILSFGYTIISILKSLHNSWLKL